MTDVAQNGAPTRNVPPAPPSPRPPEKGIAAPSFRGAESLRPRPAGGNARSRPHGMAPAVRNVAAPCAPVPEGVEPRPRKTQRAPRNAALGARNPGRVKRHPNVAATAAPLRAGGFLPQDDPARSRERSGRRSQCGRGPPRNRRTPIPSFRPRQDPGRSPAARARRSSSRFGRVPRPRWRTRTGCLQLCICRPASGQDRRRRDRRPTWVFRVCGAAPSQVRLRRRRRRLGPPDSKTCAARRGAG